MLAISIHLLMIAIAFNLLLGIAIGFGIGKLLKTKTIYLPGQTQLDIK